MFPSIRRVLIASAVLLAAPAGAYAQASIAGTIKDTSGAVLPGVRVEASSPALIEKVRSVVSDGTGQYQIVDLRPGAYTVTFTLQGFNTVRRDGIELSGSFTATVNADMKVGALEETITVTGETPIVDVQSATKQNVLTRDVIESIPSSRTYTSLTLLTPGVSTNQGNQDVGGVKGISSGDMLVHGSKLDSQRITDNGLSLAVNLGFKAPGSPPNMAAYQEVAIDAGAVDPSSTTGGVRVNLVARDGGNRFSGSNFFAFANGSMQASNFDQRLQTLGLTTPDRLNRNWDINPAFGGPLKKDRLWFFATVRQLGAYNYIGGLFYNANAGNPNAWTYVADASRPAVTQQIWTDVQGRLTLQATPRNKVGLTVDYSSTDNAPFGCACIAAAAGTSPEATVWSRFPLDRRVQLNWSSPLTNRVLLEAAALQHSEHHAPNDFGGLADASTVSVTEQGGSIPGLIYRAPSVNTTIAPGGVYGNNLMEIFLSRGAISYITGAHAFKVGFNFGRASTHIQSWTHVPYSYRFNNGVPNQITLRSPAAVLDTRYNYDLGMFAQDKWTTGRVTVNYGVRLDAFGNTIPAEFLGPTTLAPTRNITFPEQSNLALRDLTPKLSLVYDVFGTGKTAVRVSANKYLGGLINLLRTLVFTPAAVNNVVAVTTRTWTDSNRDFVPNCDLANPQANGECARDANTAFGTLGPGAVYDSDLLAGWGHRYYNWEFSAGVQQAIAPRLSVDVGFYRRIYGNFQVTHDANLAAADFSSFSITAPSDPQLPNGGGNVISGLYDINPAKFGQPAQLAATRSDNLGNQIEHYNGVDVTTNARLRNGVLLQGGISTGRTVTDNCDIVAKFPDLLVTGSTVTPQAYCHMQTPWLTQAKFLGSYTVPKIDVLVSGTFQSLPGPQVQGFLTVSNAVVRSSLGRDLAAGSNSNISVNLVAGSINPVLQQTPIGSLYGERLNQFDFLVGKVLRLGGIHATANFNLYNVFNANPALTENNQYSVFRRPTSILQARLAKVSLQFDF